MSDARIFRAPSTGPDPFDPPLSTPSAGSTEDLAAEDRPGPPSRRRLVVLGSLLAVGLAGAGLLGVTGWRIVQQKDATLDTPAQVAGLTRDDSERARAAADYLRTALAAEIDLESSIGAVYADPADAGRSVLLFGGTTLLLRPEHDLDSLLNVVTDDGAIAGLREVPAGTLGGVMKCGTSATEGDEIAVCGWADHGNVVIAMFPGRGVDDAASLLRDIRAIVQSRA